jgi:hypothetical protein
MDDLAVGSSELSREWRTRWHLMKASIGSSRVRSAAFALLTGVFGMTFAVGLGWQVPAAAVAGVSSVVLGFLAGGVTRFLAAWLIALGATGVILGVSESVRGDAHALVMAVMLVVLSFGIALVWRRSGRVTPAFIDFAGVGLGFALALVFAFKMNYSVDLTYKLLGAEDNAAWVLIASVGSLDNASLSAITVVESVGTTVPTYISMMSRFQPSTSTAGNAVMAGYAGIMILVPLALAAVVRATGVRDWKRESIVGLLATVFTLGSMFSLAAYGHFTAVGVSLILLFALAVLMELRQAPYAHGLAASAIAFVAGSFWFPVIPLAVLLVMIATAVAIRHSHGARRKLIAGGVALASIGALAMQLRQNLGSSGDANVLFRALGAGFTIPSEVLVIGLGALVVTAAATARGAFSRRDLTWVLVLYVGYAAAIVAADLVMSGARNYGSTKVSVVVFTVAVAAMIVVMHTYAVDWRTFLMACVVVSFVLVYLPGTGQTVLARSWPIKSGPPVWLAPLSTLTADAKKDGLDPSSAVCLSNGTTNADYFTAYVCSRWAEAITGAVSEEAYDYRAGLVNQYTVNDALLNRLDSSGFTPNSYVVQINAGAEPLQPWASHMVDTAKEVIVVGP